MGGGQLLHLPVDGVRGRDGFGGEVFHERGVAQRPGDAAVRDKRFELGAENEVVHRHPSFGGELRQPVASLRDGQVQGLLSQAVPAEEEPLAWGVPQRDGEHAVQA